MTSRELLEAGRLDECLSALKEEIREHPADAKRRVFLFQLLSVTGDWDRAMTQLNVAADMDSECRLMAQVCRQLLNCEAFRRDVFSGRRSPLVFGEPQPWIGLLVQACHHLAHGEEAAAATLRDQAFEEAPVTPGAVDGEPFEWIADADTRLGPMLEILVEGRYYWAPFSALKRIHIEEPVDLRDVVWLPASFVWVNEGEASGFIPTRYPESAQNPDDAVRLCRQTLWQEKEGGHALGLGQRMLATDQREYPLMDVRDITFG